MRSVAVAAVRGRGSPGPFEMKIPSGSTARIESADAEPGMTVTLQPISTRWRKIFHFIPKSRATTCGRRAAGGAPAAASSAGCDFAAVVACKRNERSRPSSHVVDSLGITS